MKDKILSLLKNKMFLIIVAVLVVLYVAVFPHTSKIKMASDFQGTYTINTEKYFLHRMVESKVENVCTPAAVVRVRTVKYGLDGSIKQTSVENCDSTSKTVIYSSDGYLKEVTQVSFVGDNIRTTTAEYNKNGQVTEGLTVTGPNSVKVTNEYDDDNKLIKTTTTTSFVNEVTEIETEEYKDGNLEKTSYENKEEGITAELTCKPDGSCELTEFSAPDYDITFNTTAGFYEVSASGKTQLTSYASVNQFTVAGLIVEADSIAETLKN